MEHLAVTSSQIASIAHDAQTLTMQVLFRRGGLYEYQDVSIDEFEQVLNPTEAHRGSVGVAYGHLIKGRKPGQKLEGRPWPASQPTVSDYGLEGEIVQPEPPKPAPAPASEPDLLSDEVQVVSRKSTELALMATQIQVINQVTQEKASEYLLAIAALRKEIADTFKPMKDAAFKAHRIICDQERTFDAPLAEAEGAVKRQIGGYVQVQQRLAREAEQQAREEAQRVAAEESRLRTQEEALQQAIDLEERGDMQGAQAVLASPAYVPVPYTAPAPVAASVAQVKGVATRMEWDFRIVDFDKVPREYLLVNESAIRQVVKATRGKVRIPGIEAFEKPVVSASRGRA